MTSNRASVRRRGKPLGAWPAALALLVGACTLAPPRPPSEDLYPSPAPAEIDWRDAVERLPALDHDRGERWPLVLWRGVGFDPLPPGEIRALLDRGIAQHLRLRETDIEAARALRAADAPVILMEGAGGAWPYDTVGGDQRWRLAFPDHADVPEKWRRLADPTRVEGWRRAAALTRQRLQRYRSAGVTVDAVWLDYEGALLHDDYQALRASTSASRIPEEILGDEARYRAYRRLDWLYGLSRSLAMPVLEVYPGASVTNWVVMVSSTADPVRSWTDWRHPTTPQLAFTDTNPIAYGIGTYFLSAWPEGHPINRANVDRFYTHLLLRQVSADARNRVRRRSGMGAVAWVARWVRDRPEERTPVMSRPAYREALRHLWLRGVDAMQVFNSPREGYEQYALWEVRDAQRVYDEMLAYREFLERGEVMNLEVPDNRRPSVMWSGLRLGDRAVVRVTNLGGDASEFELCPSRERCQTLPVPRAGRTYILRL